MPLSIGLQAWYTATNHSHEVYGYLTIGPRYVFAHVNNHSYYVDRTLNENGLGGFVNTGFVIPFCSGFLLDFFGEYS